MLDLARVAKRMEAAASGSSSSSPRCIPDSPRGGSTREAAEAAAPRPPQLPSPLVVTPRGRQRGGCISFVAAPQEAPTTTTTLSLLPSPRHLLQLSHHQTAASLSLPLLPSLAMRPGAQHGTAEDCLVAITEEDVPDGPSLLTCPSPRKAALKPQATFVPSNAQQQLPSPRSGTLLLPRSGTLVRLLPRSGTLSRKLAEVHRQAPEVGTLMSRRPAGGGSGVGPQGLLGRLKVWVTGQS